MRPLTNPEPAEGEEGAADPEPTIERVIATSAIRAPTPPPARAAASGRARRQAEPAASEPSTSPATSTMAPVRSATVAAAAIPATRVAATGAQDFDAMRPMASGASTTAAARAAMAAVPAAGAWASANWASTANGLPRPTSHRVGTGGTQTQGPGQHGGGERGQPGAEHAGHQQPTGPPPLAGLLQEHRVGRVLGVRRPALRADVGPKERLADQVGVELGEGRGDQPPAPLQQNGLVDAGPFVRGDRGARPTQGGQDDQDEQQGSPVGHQPRTPPGSHHLRCAACGRGLVRTLVHTFARRDAEGGRLHTVLFGRSAAFLTVAS